MDDKINIETIDGDYFECYQKWTHKFNQDPKKIKECFENSMYVPFINFEEQEKSKKIIYL